MKSAESRASACFKKFFANRGAVDSHSWKHAPVLGFSHFLLKSELPFLGLKEMNDWEAFRGDIEKAREKERKSAAGANR